MIRKIRARLLLKTNKNTDILKKKIIRQICMKNIAKLLTVKASHVLCEKLAWDAVLHRPAEIFSAILIRYYSQKECSSWVSPARIWAPASTMKPSISHYKNKPQMKQHINKGYITSYQVCFITCLGYDQNIKLY